MGRHFKLFPAGADAKSVTASVSVRVPYRWAFVATATLVAFGFLEVGVWARKPRCSFKVTNLIDELTTMSG